MLRALLPFIVVLPSLAYSLISLACARRFFAATPPRSPEAPAITILKPVKGMDAGSYENFASFCRQEYAGPVQLLFAAASADDPVIPVIRRLMEEFGDDRVSLVVNPAIHGPNYKVSNLINAFPQARHDIVIVCDSDIRVPADYLKNVTAHFSDPQVGLVTSLYRTSSAPTMATAIEALGFTSEMIPNVLVALHLEGLSFALGASMAVRREALAAIGGFEALVDYLADDYQLGNKVHRAGWRIALDGTFVESMLKAEEVLPVLARQLRWARTMRVSRPGGYLASGITLPFPALLLAAFLAPSPAPALAAIALLYGVRLAVTTAFSRRFVRDRLLPAWLWLIPVRDMLAFFTWALSFLGNRVEWRGSRFRLRPGGKIEELA
ncbi:bacteriohopanetetrol glucosamine biosynthesis glycosyltransferase HpnI [Geobacter sp. AOG2]|uniref:bacteriohopanetetrol glucosamine biosynthesis glycosyltransferase HpnI n=1 Tax=Geobacter sp. AOG2 TaxID=1566347 RepID=UPI001CC7E4D5|nr:bacteriohopanetetrol glucosamine biosynthesis glycosyltransferase HpnI [Geobacter sp. AOG2]GFE59940.1 ceramide glucosyltransferase [Geobacter sp. AOG2]